jgi:hypothetical protein
MMKKAVFMGFALFLAGGVFAQDSTHNATSVQHHTTVHKKTIHRNNSTMSADSVNEGKVTTNPNGKMGGKYGVKRTTKRTTTSTSSSTDSAR